jgi:hypothetical protein
MGGYKYGNQVGGGGNGQDLVARAKADEVAVQLAEKESQMIQLENWVFDKPNSNLASSFLNTSKKQLLHDFQTDVSKIGANGVVEYDTTDFYSGSRSLKMTTDISTTVVTCRVDLGSAGVSLSGKHFSILAKRALGSPRLANIHFQLWGSAFENLGKWGCTYGGSLFNSIDKWVPLTVQQETGAAIAQNVRYVDVVLTRHGSDSGQAIIKFNQLSLVTSPSKGYVTFTLDGAYTEQFTDIRNMLDVKGYKACIMQNFHYGLSTPGTNGYMYVENLRELESIGWDISTHTGVRMDTLNEQQLREVALNAKKWLIDNGFNIRKGGRFLCALQNIWTPEAVKVMGEYFHFLRTGENNSTVNAFINNQLPIFNPKGIVDMTSTTTYTRTAEVVQHAADYKEWCVITWHQGTRPNELLLSEMQNIINLIDSLGLEVVTMSDMYDRVLPTLR